MYQNFSKYDNCFESEKNKCQPNCNEVLKKYHALIAEANRLYNASNNIVDQEVITEICNALRSLDKAYNLYKEAKCINKKADMLLEKTGCDRKFNKILCRCKNFLNRAKAAYKEETSYLFKAGDLLEAALKSVEKSCKYRKMGNKLYKEYVKCIHHKEEKKSCKCSNSTGRYY